MKNTRILSMILSLVLMLGCFAGFGITASAVTYFYVTADTASELLDYGQSDGVGTIVLDADIKIDETLDIKGDITIDLNGHTIDRGHTSAKDNGQVIKVKEGASRTPPATTAVRSPAAITAATAQAASKSKRAP